MQKKVLTLKFKIHYMYYISITSNSSMIVMDKYFLSTLYVMWSRVVEIQSPSSIQLTFDSFNYELARAELMS